MSMLSMKRITIIDTWPSDTNLGNQIIMEAVRIELRELFPHAFIYEVPAGEYIKYGRSLVVASDYVFLGGTNVLSADMNRTSEWRVRIRDTMWLNKVILMGVGWWQYQERSLNWYTRVLLSNALARNAWHSVRDSYTKARLSAIEKYVVNTGCPTLWRLSAGHCDGIPEEKADIALLTFTEYNQSMTADQCLWDIVNGCYSKVYVWPQMYGDYAYARAICGPKVRVIDPSLYALDDLLRRERLDYVGTRLHAGIRALQHHRRSVIVTVDNRGVEMGKDFGLPTLARERVKDDLEQMINGRWRTRIAVDSDSIDLWKSQFGDKALS